MSTWEIVSLSDLGEVNRGKSRHRPRNDPSLYGGEYPFVQTGDVKAAQGLVTTFSQTYNDKGLAQSRLWPKGTMVITIAANIAETAILDFPACFPDSVIGFIADPTKSDVRFVEFLFRYLRRQIQSENVGTGSAQDNINLQTIGSLELSVPALSEQREIAAILGALDDKIELNRKTAATLEEMARALYRSWFVNFDPVHAKAAGRAPAHMDTQTADLFPDSFSEDGLPVGWRSVRVDEICSRIFSGGTPKTSEATFWNGEFPWLSSGETRQSFIVDTEKTITDAGIQKSSTRLARSGAVVVASAGQGKTRGQTSYLSIDSYVNQSVIACEAEGSVVSDSFLFCDLKRRYEEFRAVSDANSSRGSLTTKLIGGLGTVLPSHEVVLAFDAITAPMISKVLSGLRENETLATLRDTLLPRLMSGELRVGEAKEQLEEFA